MKNQNVITKTFGLGENNVMGTQSITFGLRPDGKYLVFIQNFEEQYGVLRTLNKNEAIEHANKLVNMLENKGYKLVA